jgi:hypothetical protein
MSELTFEQQLTQAVQQSVLKMIREGNLVVPDYAARAKVPAAKVQELYDSVDWDRVRAIVIERVEERCADSILNNMATEMATDIKQVLSNKELREEVRSFIRAGIQRIAKATQPR